jgi:hypothetical protein
MSKKLIAVASAAALALSALVATPASATVNVAYATAADATANVVAKSTDASAILDVPANNKLEYTSTATRNSLMEVTVTVTAGQTVSAVVTGKARIIDEETDATNKYTSASGSTTFTEKATTTSVVFYVFSTGTGVESLKTSVGGNSTEVFFEANPGPAYNLAVTFPASVPTSATADVTAKITDVFGNTAGDTETASASGAGAGFSSATSLSWDADDENWQGTITGSSTAGPVAVSYTLANNPTDVTGLAKAVKTAFKSMDAASLADQIKTLTAQVAALTASYNALAAKWNKRVASKTAPKKKVALK